MSYTGKQPQFTDVSTTATISAGTTVTAGTGITATSGNLVVTDGVISLDNASAKTIMTSTNWGDFLLIQNSSGTRDTFFGPAAGNNFNTNGANVGIGANALNIVEGGVNTACGFGALALLTTGGSNTAVGNALPALVTGSGNIAIGVSGSSYTTSESDNILINHAGTAGESHKIRIGTAGSGSGQQNACFIAGIFGVTVGGSGIPVNVDNAGQLGTVVSSIRFKENIEPVKTTNVLSLNPVTFNYKTDESKSRQYGLIAEDVEKVMPELVVYDDQKLPLSVRYHELPVILLAEIQKLLKRIEILENK